MPRINCGSQPFFYEIFGSGPHVVLLIPGAIGTPKSDFNIQLDKLNKNHLDFEKFTWVGVELPGWGRSTPPERNYGPNVVQFDAECCIQLMEHLGYKQYSIYSWSDGSKVAVTIASRLSSDTLRAVVMQGIFTYVSEKCGKHIGWSRNLNNWSPSILPKYVDVYGGLQRVSFLWDKHVDYITNFKKFYPYGVLGVDEVEKLKRIETPTLVVHGDKDFFVELEQEMHVANNIPNCQLVRFPKGSHNLHQEEPDILKHIVENFLLQH